MSEDAIVDEVRAIRDAIASEHNYDVDSIFRMLRQREAGSHTPHVTFPPKRLATSTGAEDVDQRASADRASGCG